MRKLLIIAVLMTSILTLAGCSVFSSGSTTTTTHPNPSPKILRQTQLAGKWQMYQIEVTLKAGDELPLVLQLKDGDKVDGYFYVEKGSNSVAFQISGDFSQVYQSDMENIPTGEAASDRFSFTVSQAQGLSYQLMLQNTAASGQSSSATIFLEVIYPGNGQVFSPLTK